MQWINTPELREWVRSVGFPIVVALILLAVFLIERREHQAQILRQLERIVEQQEQTTEAVRELVMRIR